MKLEITIDNTEFPVTLPRYLEQQLRHFLAPFAVSVRRVTARVSRYHGPGTKDQKFCRIVMHLASLSVIALEEIDGDVFRAIDRAVKQAARILRRQLEISQLPSAA
jgi:ribosome-associated translation inhibitor RaiA